MKSLRALIKTDVGVPFVAIDFETADRGPDSACAVAMVRVERQAIVARRFARIRPPRRNFLFTCIHGITWDEVAGEPTFGQCWPGLCDILAGARFLAAHYSPFDRSVLEACCGCACLPVPELPFLCTVKLARETWNVRPTKLPNVCAHLKIPLTHHDPCSDAEACARIVIEASRCLCQPVG
jgi:DNA polymerase-3 subunit epsilon